MNGKYYWLKLKKDYLKRHDLKILEAMPHGERSVLFYIKLMLESIDHEGELRFSDKIPYTPETLATITGTKTESVKTALVRLQDLELIEIKNDGTIVLPHVKSMIGCADDSDNAKRQKRYRERKKAEKQGVLEKRYATESVTSNVTSNVTHNITPVTNNNESIEIEKEKEIDIDIKRNVKEKTLSRFIPPTVEEVRAYCLERGNNVDPEKFIAYYTSNGWKVGKNPMKDWRAAVITWERKDKTDGNMAYPYRKPEGNIGMFSHLRDKE